MLGWSLDGMVGCSMIGRILVVHTWRSVISLAGESGLGFGATEVYTNNACMGVVKKLNPNFHLIC